MKNLMTMMVLGSAVTLFAQTRATEPGATPKAEPPKAAAGASAKVAGLTPTEIIDRANKVLRGDSSHARLTMTIVTPDWTRELDIEGWNQGREKAFILIHAPAKDKGNTTLRRGNEMWVWMSKVERTMKVPPTMMQSSWQGSDFTYEDIVKADSIVKDFDHKVVHRDSAPDHERVEIQADPKPDAPTVWGKILYWADVYEHEVVPVKEEDYNDRGELVRTITLSEVERWPASVDSKELIRVPTRLECDPKKKPGQKTVMKYKKLDFGIKLNDSFFSLSRLQK